MKRAVRAPDSRVWATHRASVDLPAPASPSRATPRYPEPGASASTARRSSSPRSTIGQARASRWWDRPSARAVGAALIVDAILLAVVVIGRDYERLGIRHLPDGCRRQ